MINELDFFNKATLRICSSLDIGEVAQECLDYLTSYIPLDGVMMSYYNEKPILLLLWPSSPHFP